jgi:hypothetical protein
MSPIALSWQPMRALLALTLLLTVWASIPISVSAASSESPSAHCRGSTRAHVRIAWPSRADWAIDRHLPFRHIPYRIRRWGYLIVPAARANHISPYLVAGVMQMESDGDPLAGNLDSDARGLMQVLHAPFQPAANIRIGVAMLPGFLHQFRRPDLALAAYNAGPGCGQQYGGLPPFPETRDYVVMVQYFRDHDAGLHLSTARTVHFKAALRNLIAVSKRLCS